MNNKSNTNTEATITESKLSLIHRSGLQYLSMALVAILLGAGGAYLAIYNAQSAERDSGQKAVALAEDKQASNTCQTMPEMPSCQLAKDIIADQPVNIPGDRGPKGNEGDTGPRGPQGIQGLLGLPGLEGVPGTPGTNGKDGFSGKDGVQGPIGPIGPTGPEGKQGLQGEPGAPGAPGADGSQITFKSLTCTNDVLTITLSNGDIGSVPVACDRQPKAITPLG